MDVIDPTTTRADDIRRLCGETLYAGEWPREAMLDAMRLTGDWDAADAAARPAISEALLAAARIHAPHVAVLVDGETLPLAA